jgi:hypothetical protein
MGITTSHYKPFDDFFDNGLSFEGVENFNVSFRKGVKTSI